MMTDAQSNYLALSLSYLANRMLGSENEDASLDALDILWMVMSEQEQEGISRELNALSFLSVSIGYRHDIERRWAKDNKNTQRLQMYGITEEAPDDCLDSATRV